MLSPARLVLTTLLSSLSVLGLNISGPAFPESGVNFDITWSGGQTPYTIYVLVAANQSEYYYMYNGSALSTIWDFDLPVGTEIVYQALDDLGDEATTPNVSVIAPLQLSYPTEPQAGIPSTMSFIGGLAPYTAYVLSADLSNYYYNYTGSDSNTVYNFSLDAGTQVRFQLTDTNEVTTTSSIVTVQENPAAAESQSAQSVESIASTASLTSIASISSASVAAAQSSSSVSVGEQSALSVASTASVGAQSSLAALSAASVASVASQNGGLASLSSQSIQSIQSIQTQSIQSVQSTAFLGSLTSSSSSAPPNTASRTSTSSTTNGATNTPNPDNNGGQNNSKNSSNTGAIVGGAVGGVGALALIAVLIFFLVRRSRARDDDAYAAESGRDMRQPTLPNTGDPTEPSANANAGANPFTPELNNSGAPAQYAQYGGNGTGNDVTSIVSGPGVAGVGAGAAAAGGYYAGETHDNQHSPDMSQRPMSQTSAYGGWQPSADPSQHTGRSFPQDNTSSGQQSSNHSGRPFSASPAVSGWSGLPEVQNPN